MKRQLNGTNALLNTYINRPNIISNAFLCLSFSFCLFFSSIHQHHYTLVRSFVKVHAIVFFSCCCFFLFNILEQRWHVRWNEFFTKTKTTFPTFSSSNLTGDPGIWKYLIMISTKRSVFTGNALYQRRVFLIIIRTAITSNCWFGKLHANLSNVLNKCNISM